MDIDEKEIPLADINCANCAFCYFAKDDDGSWLMCQNQKASKYIKSIDNDFGCVYFESR